jgi:nucleotide-binding universal stress UspA family protein
MMLKRILIPLDGSTEAEAVLPKTQVLFAHENMEVLLVPAVPRGNARHALERARERLNKGGLRVRSIFAVPGQPASVILEVARKEGVMLIVMSAPDPEVFSGKAPSVAAEVLQASPAPVLFVRSLPRSPLSFQSILLPVGGSASARTTVPAAADLARASGGTILVLHVTEPPGKRETDMITRHVLYDTERMLLASGIRTATKIVEGDPATRILDISQAAHADVIVMAAHGGSDPSRPLLGNVAEEVFRASSLPMLLAGAHGRARTPVQKGA